MPRESILWASIGWSAPSIRHIICRVSAADTGAALVDDLGGQRPGHAEHLVGRVQAADQAAGEGLLRPGTPGPSGTTRAPG